MVILYHCYSVDILNPTLATNISHCKDDTVKQLQLNANLKIY